MLKNKFALGLSSLALLFLTACTAMPLTSEISDAIAKATTAADHQQIAALGEQRLYDFATAQ